MKAANTITIKKNVIWVRAVGDQTQESIEALYVQAESSVQQILSRYDKLNVAIDVSKVTGHTMGARIAAKPLMENLRAERLGIFGADFKFGILLKLIIKGARAEETARYFDTADQVVRWFEGKQ